MILETQQQLSFPTRLTPSSALAFIRSPQQLLTQLSFLQEVEQRGEQVSGVLALSFPMLGEVTLPFVSLMSQQPHGAVLLPQALTHERAWLEIAGQGHLEPPSDQPGQSDYTTTQLPRHRQIHYHFQFRAYLQTPDVAQQWGAKAFEKMVQASAQRTINRVAQALPVAFARALETAEHEQQQLS